jgi:hypothetical protein
LGKARNVERKETNNTKVTSPREMLGVFTKRKMRREVA